MTDQFLFGCIVGAIGGIVFIITLALQGSKKKEEPQVIDAHFVDKPEAPSQALVKHSTVLIVKPRNQEVMYGRPNR